jgi:ADP-heptose:LPS heptosyltransferase
MVNLNAYDSGSANRLTAGQSRRPQEQSKILNPKSKILLIRASALGDVARTVPCLVSLRRAFPGARIDWLVDARYADAVRGHPMLDGVVPFDRRRKWAVGALLRRLRAAEYDWVVDLQGLARSGLFAGATRAPVRVGYANAREFGWLGLNRRHRIDPARHSADRMLALLEAEGIERVADFTLHVPPEARGYAARFVTETEVLRRDILHQPESETPNGAELDYVCLAPTAQWGCKCWPIQRYAAVATGLLERGDAAGVVVLAAPRERDRIFGPMMEAVPDGLADRVGFAPTTVGQMMDVIQHARLLVGNDSAPLHLAVGLGTPTVSLFGPTDPALVGPPPPDIFTALPGSETHGRRLHRVLRAPSAIGKSFNYRRHRDDNALIGQITVEAVEEAIAQTMGADGP